MPRDQRTISQKLASDEALFNELNHRIHHFNEVERAALYRDFWPEYADKEAPRLLRNLKAKRNFYMKRITMYKALTEDSAS